MPVVCKQPKFSPAGQNVANGLKTSSQEEEDILRIQTQLLTVDTANSQRVINFLKA
ncbi:hypothetical protein Pst134EA_019173 [Puccinia striiformis f. sp. tritici]|uniref:hypothetical protein n=1 Tax=Puccinia striiformis f. sp. tritici TaxID=168172 RepID=UPI002007301D|nr:hypothetical protein Pst134EA_019173 [Puccinia striiformis f. sp. tritici]KAH9459023.1 hypothetical protein Pst134EA_019173 [Puccinia striiformis f. sp. tritici]